MGTRRRVAAILGNALTLSLTAPLIASCGIDTDDFTPIACRNNGGPTLLAGVVPKTPAGYIELRQLADDIGGTTQTLESVGTKCDGAMDVALCSATISSPGATTGFSLGNCVDFCSPNILIANTGDTVEVIDTKVKLKEWLGPIDSRADAVLLVASSGYQIACGTRDEGGVREADGGGYEVLATKYTAVCDPIERTLFVLGVDAGGTITEVESEVLESESGACIGRRPTGLARAKGRGRTRLGAHFASIAHLEAASVHAFDTLERELLHHRAPRHLVIAARAARRDEIRHAKVMTRMARRYGGMVPQPRVDAQSMRSLEDIALENATEGCIRETFGALVGMWQAKFAKDERIRHAMERIARDETNHASLSWAIHHWVQSKLTPEARERIAEARRRTLQSVLAEARQGYDPDLVEMAGLPDCAAGERLAQQFERAVGELSAA